jgi:hypothetical protein
MNLDRIAAAARRSASLHRCLATGRGLPSCLAAFPADRPASAVGPSGLDRDVPGWSLRTERIDRQRSRYVWRRTGAAS